jgi:enamine deaminase RidA (YjgF/YER057c/UK114 family)
MRRLISSGSPLEAAVGYSRAVVDGEWIFVAGTTGFDYPQMTIAEDPAEQARQAFRSIEQALAEAARSPMSYGCTTTYPTSRIGPRSCRCWAKSSARSARPPRHSSAASSTRG